MSDIAIKKVVLNLGGKEISLTIEQAKKLKGSLEELFGKEIIKEVIHDHHYDWHWRYRDPYYALGLTTLGSTTTDNSRQFAFNARADLKDSALQIDLSK